MANGIVSLISLSELLFLVYRKASNFCVLILYLATLPNSLMSSSSILVASLGFSVYSIMSSANRDSFTSFYLIWIPFISFSSLISMVRTSKTLSNNSGEGGLPTLFLILEEMLSDFPCWEWYLLYVASAQQLRTIEYSGRSTVPLGTGEWEVSPIFSGFLFLSHSTAPNAWNVGFSSLCQHSPPSTDFCSRKGQSPLPF